MNRRIVLALLAVAVLAAAVVLYVKLREPGNASASPQNTTTTAAAEDKTPVASGPNAPVTPVRRDPAQNVGSEKPETTEYEVDGVQIRDHRKGDHPPDDLPPNIHPPGTHRIAPTVTQGVSTKLQAVMHECIASLPAEARGTKPRLEGTLQIAVKNQQVRVTQSTMQLRDVVGDAVEPTKRCIEEKSLGISSPATNEPDLDSYSISIKFALL